MLPVCLLCSASPMPAIFGVNLRLRWPFYIGMGASAIASTLIALFDVKATALGAAGLIGFVSMRPEDYTQFFICAIVSLILAFGVAFAYGRYLISKNGSIDPDETGAVTATSSDVPSATAAPNAYRVASPLTGSAVALSAVSDPMFAAGKLGAGAAIEPIEGRLVSPIDGKVTVTFPSKHAYAVRGKDAEGNNVDILMHIGFDTVNLKGEHFTSHVSKGDEVKVGDLLCEFDIEAIKAADYPVTTPVVVSNSKKTGSVLPAYHPGEDIAFGDALLTVDPKVTEEAAASPTAS